MQPNDSSGPEAALCLNCVRVVREAAALLLAKRQSADVTVVLHYQISPVYLAAIWVALMLLLKVPTHLMAAPLPATGTAPPAAAAGPVSGGPTANPAGPCPLNPAAVLRPQQSGGEPHCIVHVTLCWQTGPTAKWAAIACRCCLCCCPSRRWLLPLLLLQLGSWQGGSICC